MGSAQSNQRAAAEVAQAENDALTRRISKRTLRAKNQGEWVEIKNDEREFERLRLTIRSANFHCSTAVQREKQYAIDIADQLVGGEAAL